MDHIAQKIEALLFVHGEPMEIKKISAVIKADPDAVRAGIAELETNLRDRGLSVISHGDRVELVTKPEFATLIEEVIKKEFNEALTPAALETLSIIAYAGSIARNTIDYIRGVNSSFIIRALLIRGLIERAPDPERAHTYLYGPSFECLRHLGVANATSLPDFEKYHSLIEKLKSGA
jgi:segregation and condensation protein B